MFSRKISVQYAKRQVGNKMSAGGQQYRGNAQVAGSGRALQWSRRKLAVVNLRVNLDVWVSMQRQQALDGFVLTEYRSQIQRHLPVSIRRFGIDAG